MSTVTIEKVDMGAPKRKNKEGAGRPKGTPNKKPANPRKLRKAPWGNTPQKCTDSELIAQVRAEGLIGNTIVFRSLMGGDIITWLRFDEELKQFYITNKKHRWFVRPMFIGRDPLLDTWTLAPW